MHPVVVPLALPISFATGILRDLGGVLTPLFLLRGGYPFLARRKKALLWLDNFTLNEGPPYLQALAPRGSFGLLTALAVAVVDFAMMALALLFSPPWAQPLAWGLLKAIWWEGMVFTALDLGTDLANNAGLTASALKTSRLPDLVWSETAFPLPYFGVEKAAWIGGVGGTGSNAVYLTQGGAVVAARSKAYFIPDRERARRLAPVRSQAHLQAGFTPPQGDLPRGELKPLGRFGALICYEATPSVPAAKLAAMGAEALVIVSNEGAFDGTLLKRHRLRQDRLRAAETGPSGSVDPRGHPAFLSPKGKRGAWLTPLGYRRGETPYVALIRAPTGGGAR